MISKSFLFCNICCINDTIVFKLFGGDDIHIDCGGVGLNWFNKFFLMALLLILVN